MAVAKTLIPQVMESLPPDLLVDFNHFVRISNQVKNLAKVCNPSVIRATVNLEKYKRLIVDAIKNRRDKGEMSKESARKAIDLVYQIYNEALDTAERDLEVCFSKLQTF